MLQRTEWLHLLHSEIISDELLAFYPSKYRLFTTGYHLYHLWIDTLSIIEKQDGASLSQIKYPERTYNCTN